MSSILGMNKNGLVYSGATVGELVNKDTDGDGILDWEEPLYGLDPTTKETTPGVPDSSVIKKLKSESEYNLDGADGSYPSPENLTETDKFSQELFSTVATLNQTGGLDEMTADKISSSLAEHIKNSVPKKIYTLADLKIINSDSNQTIQNYAEVLDNVFKKYPMDYSINDVLQKFVVDGNNVDTSVLVELDPIITQLKKVISEMIKISVPKSLSSLHLDFLNGLERLSENLSDIKLYDSDAIVALGGVSQYKNNSALLESSVKNLADEIANKLNN